jgi:CheY-like chemotaxis protein
VEGAESEAPVPVAREQRVNLLLVCDTPRVSSQVSSALPGDADTQITEVRTPQRALQLIDDRAQARFDVVIADADTHPTGGFALCREIKARGQMGRTMPPVVLLIARDQDAWLSDWSQADAHVRKPPDPLDFAAVIEALVSRRPLPSLPGVGGSPVPSVLDVPGRKGDVERDEHEASPEPAHGHR